MKNPKMLIGVLAALLILGGAVALVMNESESSSNNEANSSESNDVMEKKDGDAMEKSEESEVMEKHDGDAMEKMEKDDDAVMEKKDNEVMEKSEEETTTTNSTSTFVSLADYDSNQSTYSENTKVLFFHASWCPICNGIEDEMTTDPSRIPSGTTFIKTNYDTETKLRQKHGVNTQFTFVQVDNDGNQIAKWSATSLDKALAGIQS